MASGEGKTRRDFVKLTAAGAAGAAALAACGAPAAPTAAPAKPTEAPKPQPPRRQLQHRRPCPCRLQRPPPPPSLLTPPSPLPRPQPPRPLPPRRQPPGRCRGAGCQAEGRAAQQAAHPDVVGHSGQVHRPQALEPVRDRRQPPERPGPLLRAALLLQRVRRQVLPVAGRRATPSAPTSAADDQAALGHLLERRHAVQRRRRRLHPTTPCVTSGTKVRWGPNVKEFVKEAKATDPQTRRRHLQHADAALHPLHVLQVRHRRLHRPEAHLLEERWTGTSSRTTTSPRASR